MLKCTGLYENQDLQYKLGSKFSICHDMPGHVYTKYCRVGKISRVWFYDVGSIFGILGKFIMYKEVLMFV